MAKKKKVSKKVINTKMECCVGGKGWMHIWAILTLISFVFFVITVWPAAMNWVSSVGWAWFLGATIVFKILKIITWKRAR